MRDDSEAIVHMRQHGRPRCKRGSTAWALPMSLAMRITRILVGRVGVEPTTSRLSGVRSNHLSYRPIAAHPLAPSVAAKPRLMARYAALAELTDVQNSLRCFVSSVPV